MGWVAKSWITGSNISQALKQENQQFRRRMEEISLYDKSVNKHNHVAEENRENVTSSMLQTFENVESNYTSTVVTDKDDTSLLNETAATDDSCRENSKKS